MAMNPHYLSDFAFIQAAEDGSLTDEQLRFNVQRFVDNGYWRSLQGAWQRQVEIWIDAGLAHL